MGSVMDQERPWEREKRLDRYRSIPLKYLQAEIEYLSDLPWEKVAYRGALEIYKERIREDD